VKQVIVNEQLQEIEVHPPELYPRLVDICVASATDLLDQLESFVETGCPACHASEKQPAFEKHGYTYWSCQSCATLFVSPRPSTVLMDRYLLDSPMAAFRDSDDYHQAMAQRTKELGYYRAEWVGGLSRYIHKNKNQSIVDVETRSPAYLTALSQQQNNPLICVKPLCTLPDDLKDKLTTVNELAELPEQAKIVTLFDILEHQFNPADLIQAAYSALRPGGLLVITTRSGSGLDIQALWEHATIFPVEHINLISVEGIRLLLERVDFEIVEESTPGQLDVQMIERIIQEQPDVDAPRFLKYFLTHRDRYAKRKFQQFLQENLLSSHLRVVARKRNS